MKKFFQMAILAIILSVSTAVATDNGFIFNDYDVYGRVTLNCTRAVTDDNLNTELTQIGGGQKTRESGQTVALEDIRAINLIDQGNITDKSLRLLERLLPNLSFLNVENTGVTQLGKQGFMRAMPNCTVP